MPPDDAARDGILWHWSSASEKATHFLGWMHICHVCCFCRSKFCLTNHQSLDRSGVYLGGRAFRRFLLVVGRCHCHHFCTLPSLTFDRSDVCLCVGAGFVFVFLLVIRGAVAAETFSGGSLHHTRFVFCLFVGQLCGAEAVVPTRIRSD